MTNHTTVRKTHPGSWILVGTGGFKQDVIWQTLFYRDYNGELSSFFYLCKEFSESLIVREVTDVSGVEVVQSCNVCLVHLILLTVHLI